MLHEPKVETLPLVTTLRSLWLALLGLPVFGCTVVNAPAEIVASDTPAGCQSSDDCKASAGPCADVTCNAGVCESVAKKDGTTCDDGLYCTEKDACAAGKCVGSAVSCPSPMKDPCQVGVCDEAAKGCSTAPSVEGIECPAVDACSPNGRCSAGKCSAKSACDALGDDCKTASCDAMANPPACAPAPKNEGNPCNVGNACAAAGTCAAGACVDAMNNAVAKTPDGTACDDGLFCTLFDACVGGKCVAGTQTPCGPGGSCSKTTCDEAKKSCDAADVNEGGSCANNKCQTGATCKAGVCAGGMAQGVLFADDFSDASKGWVSGSEWAIGAAKSGAPVSSFGADPGFDHTGAKGSGVAGVVLGGGPDTSMSHDFVYLTSPAIDASSAAMVTLSFYRWLNTPGPDKMVHRIEASADGVAWSTVWESKAAIRDFSPIGPGWNIQEGYDLTPYKSAKMQLRFGFSVVAAGSPAAGSWNIDDVVVSSGAACF